MIGALRVTGNTTAAGRSFNASSVQYTPTKLAKAARLPYNKARPLTRFLPDRKNIKSNTKPMAYDTKRYANELSPLRLMRSCPILGRPLSMKANIIRRNHRLLLLFFPLAKASFDQETRNIDVNMNSIPVMFIMLSFSLKNTVLKMTGIKNDDL